MGTKEKKVCIYTLLCWALLLAGCQTEGKKEQMVGESMGAQSEVLLVADDEVLQSDLADTLDNVLCGSTPGLNQTEPFFRLIHLSRTNYSMKYGRMHSIIMVELNPGAKEATIGVAYDQKARPQTMVQVMAPSLDALRTFLSAHKQDIRDLLLDGQLNAQAKTLKKKHSKLVAEDTKRMFGFEACVPVDIKYDKKGKDFLWASDQLPEKNKNYVCYTYPYTGEDITDECFFATKRDSVMKANIPGSRPSQWMATVWEGDTPMLVSRLRHIDGTPVQEIHGLWEMHDGAMGGPFVSLVKVDTKARRVIVTEGFIYSPSTTKRDLIRTMEAALRVK